MVIDIKETRSKVLFGLTVLMLILTVCLCVNIAITLYQLYTVDVDSAKETLPGGAALAKGLYIVSTWIGFWLGESFLSLVGFVSAAINRKKTTIPFIRRFSVFCVYLFGGIMCAIFVSAFYAVLVVLG